jgi:UDP-GlcNAc:undecaprenyl-phosphate/decaprenyl-phosphate GlcNAc-1-phosphate transferase
MTNGWNVLGWFFLLAGAASFVLSLVLTRVMIGLSQRIGFVDKPGHRKIHLNPKPLGGGVAIFVSMLCVVTAGLFASNIIFNFSIGNATAFSEGLRQQLPLVFASGIATGVMHVMGLLDDRRAMGPYVKLFVQLGVTAALVIVMEMLAEQTPSLRLRVLTTLDAHVGGSWLSIVVTVLWITAMSAGVAVVCATAFFVAAVSIGQIFVAAALAIFIGAVLGFLGWNFPPSRIFMGDSGSLVLGFLLGVLTVKTTFLPDDARFQTQWWAVLAPVIVLAVPLYDLVVVSMIRLSRGHSPFRGDTNHFSHRLVARGMSRRTAVLCIYLVSAATSIAAIVLPQVQNGLGALLIVLQTLLVLGVVLILEQHPLPVVKKTDDVLH